MTVQEKTGFWKALGSYFVLPRVAFVCEKKTVEQRVSPGPVLGANRVLDETVCPAAEVILAAYVQDKVQVHCHATYLQFSRGLPLASVSRKTVLIFFFFNLRG